MARTANFGAIIIPLYNMHTEMEMAFNIGNMYELVSHMIRSFPYPEPMYTGWSSVHWNASGMPLVDPVYTGITLGHPANTCRVHLNTTGKT